MRASTGKRGGIGFEEFVAARSPALLRTAWLLTGDDGLAEDLVQTALASRRGRAGTRCSRRPGGLRPRDRRDHLRHVVAAEWRGEVPTGRCRTGDARRVRGRRLRDPVRRASRAPHPRQRAVVVLRHFDDLTGAQTAAALGISVGTVKSQHARDGVAALAPHLGAS